ncbi:MAG: heme-binding domain-containing protein [Aliarcobacter sp.]|nr:heme-binding domain-containing protein [Aliarcobacter sp.]
MKKTLLIFLIIFVVIQFIRPQRENIPVDKELEIKADTKVMEVFQKACYDCHSNTTTWPWYSQIAPFSWAISSHVIEGRKALNFSSWENYSVEEKEKKIKDIYRTVYVAMPLQSYIMAHKEADLTKEERTFIRNWTGVRAK